MGCRGNTVSQGRQVGAGGTGWTMGFPGWGSGALRTLGVLGGLLFPHVSGLGSGEWLEGGGAKGPPGGSQILKFMLCLTLIFFSPLNMRSCVVTCPSVLSPASSLVLQTLTRPFFLFVSEVLLDPCRTWCPASTCQAVCQLQEMGLHTPQLVQCKACDTEFCSACKASWHPGQGCPETMPITFLPGETRYLPACLFWSPCTNE